jgi:hypothetical protein
MEYGLVNGKNPVAGIQECSFRLSLFIFLPGGVVPT